MVNILKRYKNASPAAKASMALLFANLILKGLSLISGPIFTRLMDSSQYGIVSTFSSWQGVLSAVITLNLAAGVFNNGMLEYKDDRDTFQFSLLFISMISTLIWFAIFLALRNKILSFLSLPEISVYLMFLYFFFVPAFSLWSGRQRYEYKYKALSVLTVIIALVSLILGIIAVVFVNEKWAAITRIGIMEGVYVVVGIVFFIIFGIKAHFKIKKSYCLYALRFNVPLIPHYLSMYVLSSSDRIMIMKMISTNATAIYSVAYTAASVITIVWQSVEASLSPWIYEKLDNNMIAPIRKITLEVLMLFAGISLFCTMLAPEIMKVLAPSEYSSGIYVIPPVSAGVFFTAMYSLYMRIELFYKQTAFATVASTLAALLNIILNYIFINIFGAVAAGYTTMVCYAFLALFHYINVKKKGYSQIVNNKAFLLLSLVVIGTAIVISLLYAYPIIRVSLIICAFVFAIWKRKQIISLIKIKM